MSSLRPHLSTRQSGMKCCPKPPREHCVTEYRRQKEIEFICYSEWLPNVRLLVPHVPDDILLDYIRRACIEFARQSAILTRNVELLLQERVADYWPCLGDQERIDRVQLLSINGQCYTAVGDTCEWEFGGYRYWFHPPNSLEIHPAPKRCGRLIFTVTATPSENSSQVDRLIYDRYQQAIVDHAVANAMMIPPRDDSDGYSPPSPGWAAELLRRFSIAVARAKIDAARNYSNKPQTWGSGGCCGM